MQVTAGAAIDAGMMIAILPADGEAYMATDATATLAVIGRAESSAAEGDTLLAKRGVFRWDNAGAFTAADIGQQCYAFGNASVTTATIATNDIPCRGDYRLRHQRRVGGYLQPDAQSHHLGNDTGCNWQCDGGRHAGDNGWRRR